MGRRIDPNVEVSSEVKNAMQGYVPCVGNSEDINIAKVYSKVLNLATLLRDTVERRKELDQVVSESSIRVKELKAAEKELLSLMKKRKCQKK